MDYGLIGRHLTHSFSKSIHERVESYNYLLKELEPEEIQSFMMRKNFKAINVTIPYKEEVIKYLDYKSPEVDALNACNTIVRKDSKLYGYNTDIYGLKSSIINANFNFKDKVVLILGTGGASKATLYVSKELNAKEVILVSRTKGDGYITYDDISDYYDKANFIINATPVGMYPNNYDKPIVLYPFNSLEGVIDLVYNPLKTKLIEEAESLGIKSINGMYMLVSQALYSIDLFMDTTIDKSITQDLVNELIKEKRNIVLIGMPTSGKTTIGLSLSRRLHMAHVDTDQLIMKRIKMPIKRFFKIYGEDKFREIESEVIKEVSKLNSRVISTGGGTILKDENMINLKMNSIIIFIDRDKDNLFISSSRPLTSTRDDVDKLYDERISLYRKYADITITNNGEYKDALIKIMEALKWKY